MTSSAKCSTTPGVFKAKDDSHVVIVHLDMDKGTIGFSIDDKFLSVAFYNVEDGEYRLAISMAGKRDKKFEFIE